MTTSTDSGERGSGDRFLLLFIDGVGLAPAGPDNPLSRRPTPGLAAAAGGPLTLESVRRSAEPADPVAGGDGARRRLLLPLDAGLGVPGLPQSATGQTALFTGINAPRLVGRHVSAFPGRRLQGAIAERSLFRRAVEAGRRTTFANAYTPGYQERIAENRRISVTTRAVLAGGLDLRTLDDLAAGRAVTWDITRERFAGRARELGHPVELEPVAAAVAGAHLAALAAGHHLTVFETFLTDLAGHRRFGLEPEDAVERLDGLLAGLLEHLDPAVTLLMTSDHGNLEDASHTVHTENPVPLLAVGPRAAAFEGLTRLTEVTPRLVELLRGSHAGRD